MPATDPTLEAAVERFLAVGVRFDRLERGSAFRAGWESCLRSLGAGTPEARAALRELVKTLEMWTDARRHYTGRAVRDAYAKFEESVLTFAALATPTEEGTC